MHSSDDQTNPDGRILRGKRTRQLIIEATLQLIEDGNLVPTAQQISEQAGVGIRSLFRHFSDVESMFKAIDDSIRDHYENLFRGGDRSGSLEVRILHAIRIHANAYEKLEKILLSTQARRWHSEVLRKNYARSQRRLRKDLDIWLPELESVPPATREAIDAIASFEFWNRLREHQGLTVKASIDVVVKTLAEVIPKHL